MSKKADSSPNDDQLTPAERAASKAAKRRQQAFLAASTNGDLLAQVQIAREQARDLLIRAASTPRKNSITPPRWPVSGSGPLARTGKASAIT
jgi:hypothetical protein